jgi:uncharacterized protein
MKSTEGRPGRIFIIRLEHEDVIPQCIEEFAEARGVKSGQVTLEGGIGSGEVVVDPPHSEDIQIDPMVLPIDGAHEVVGIGVLAPGVDGKPVLHIHGSLGRSGQSVTGCFRRGVRTWLVGEVIIHEITDADVVRAPEGNGALALLQANSGRGATKGSSKRAPGKGNKRNL